MQRVLVYGAGSSGRSIFSALVRSPKLGLRPVAIVNDDSRLAGSTLYEYGYRRKDSIPVIEGPLTAEMIHTYGARLVVVGSSSVVQSQLDDLLAVASAAKATVAFVPQALQAADSLPDYMDIDGVLLISLNRNAKKRWYRIVKRLFDSCASFVLLIATTPLWIVIAAAILLDSSGPVFFRQKRVGLLGTEFELYKFRSMQKDAPVYELHPAHGSDPRVTRVGRWLRRTGLDELPQLINILKGNMSLVGPRPEMPFIAEAPLRCVPSCP